MEFLYFVCLSDWKGPNISIERRRKRDSVIKVNAILSALGYTAMGELQEMMKFQEHCPSQFCASISIDRTEKHVWNYP